MVIFCRLFPKDDACREAREDFKREAEIMSSFNHENILKLIGIVSIGACFVNIITELLIITSMWKRSGVCASFVCMYTHGV